MRRWEAMGAELEGVCMCARVEGGVGGCMHACFAAVGRNT